MIEEDRLIGFLDQVSGKTEVVLTGRGPSERLTARADYITEMKKIKHPYECGVSARRGVEY